MKTKAPSKKEANENRDPRANCLYIQNVPSSDKTFLRRYCVRSNTDMSKWVRSKIAELRKQES